MPAVVDRESRLAMAGLGPLPDAATRWKNGPATPIQRPTNEIRHPGPPTETRYKNPLDRRIHAQTRTQTVGNASLHDTFANPRRPASSHSAPPPSKRPRLEHTSGKSPSSHFISSTSNKRDGLRLPPDSTWDEMNILSSHEPKRLSKYPFTSDKGLGSSTPALTMPQEGEAYMKLEAKFSDPDPIEEYIEPHGSGYEDKSMPCQPTLLKLDFIAMRQHGLKGGMKKAPSKARQLSITPTAAPKSGFSEKDRTLPVSYFYINAKEYASAPQAKLSMRDAAGVVSIGERLKTHWTGSLVDGCYTVILGDPATVKENPVIQFQPMDSTIKPTVTIQLEVGNRTWDDGHYRNFLQNLDKLGVKKLFMRNTAQLWEAAKQNAQISQEETDNNGNRRGRKAGMEVPSSSLQELTKINHGKRKASNLETHLNGNEENKSLISKSAKRDTHALEIPKRELRSSKRSLRSTLKTAADCDVEVVDMRIENADEVILSYPAGLPGAVNITNADLMRLKPGQFLNDTLIEFGLKLWLSHLEDSNPTLASQIHVFNSFFYKKLNSKDPQVGYESVRKWTSKIDIFSKKYIVVPINEHVHWYLAVIYEPEHVLDSIPAKVNTSSRPQTRRSTALLNTSNLEDHTAHGASLETHIDDVDRQSELEVECHLQNFNTSCTIDSKEQKLPASSNYDDLFGSDLLSPKSDVEMSSPDPLNVISDSSCSSPTPPTYGQSSKPLTLPTADTMIIDIPDSPARPNLSNTAPINPTSFYQSSSRSKGSGKKRTQNSSDSPTIDLKECIDQSAAPKTYIFTFDSLGGRHLQAVKKLSAYLRMEAKDKKKIDGAGMASGKAALVPSQENFCDCGLYLLHFARTFLSDAKNYASVVLNSTSKVTARERSRIWREEEILNNSGRDMLASHILSLSERWKKDRVDAKERTPVYDVEKGGESEGEVELVESDLGKKSKRLKSGVASRPRG